MKQLLTSLLVLLTLYACQKPYEKAVNDYVQKKFNNPDSYECVELSEPVEYTVRLGVVEETIKKGKEAGLPNDTILAYIDRTLLYLEKEGTDINHVLYRYVEHTYRADNTFGVKTLFKERWFLSNDLTTVYCTEPK